MDITALPGIKMWRLEGRSGRRWRGRRGRHCDAQDRTPSCLLHKPLHILQPLLLRSALEAEGLRSFWSDYVKSGTGFASRRITPTELSPLPQTGMLSRSRLRRSVPAEQWRHRSFTMSCLDVMYPAYGHYAPYAPTAPAFINSIQVGCTQIFKVQLLPPPPSLTGVTDMNVEYF